jgi:hypothetical protein
VTRAHAPRQVTGLGDIAKSYLKGWFVTGEKEMLVRGFRGLA